MNAIHPSEKVVHAIEQSEIDYMTDRMNAIRERPGNPEGVEVAQFGHAVCFYSKTMPWPSFNTVKGLRSSDIEYIDDMIRFYRERARKPQLELVPGLADQQVLRSLEERGLAGQFQGFYPADARDLGIFADEQFDASLMMGPLYHLQAEEDQHAAVQELFRVTKRGGIVFVAVMTVVRHVMNSLLHPQHWKPNDSIGQIRGFMETGIFNHQDEGRFTGVYYFRVEEIAPFMEAHGFETVQLLGSSSIAGAMNEQQFDYWRSRGEDEYRQVMELIYEMASCPHVLGVSSHLLYIGRKK